MRKNIVLSKSLVGIRMPRAVRNGLVIAFLNSAAGRALVAEAFVLAAGVFGPRKLRASVKSRKGQGPVVLRVPEGDEGFPRGTGGGRSSHRSG
jgi:hypothetical protein